MTEREKAAAAKAAALKAREEAELRVEADMVTMNSLVEALSKNLGQLHYLRTICFGPEDQKWRDYASRLSLARDRCPGGGRSGPAYKEFEVFLGYVNAPF